MLQIFLIITVIAILLIPFLVIARFVEKTKELKAARGEREAKAERKEEQRHDQLARDIFRN